VTGDSPPLLRCNQERAWSPPELQLEKVAFTLSSHRRVSVTQQWQGQLARPRPPRQHNRTRTSCHRPATTLRLPRSRKTRNQRNANAIPSSNTKISRLQSFLVRMKTLLILQKLKTSSLLPQPSPKRISIPTWRSKPWKLSKCTSVSPTMSVSVSHLPPLSRLDTQGLLDRVFPLSDDQPESSCSLRTLLQDSPNHSLRALRVRTLPTPEFILHQQL
jgi:hypothetical protein